MKLDLDPNKNRIQYEKLRKFSVKFTVMNKLWFYYLFGAIPIIIGLGMIFTVEGTWELPKDGYSQNQYGLFLTGLGIAIIFLCKLIAKLNKKISNYKPEKNTGDEWFK